MNKRISALITAVAIMLITFSGCAKLVDEPEDNTNNVPSKFNDVFTGAMFTLYEKGEDWFVPVTSTTYGDDNCIAEYVKYSNQTGVDWYTVSDSGDGYLSANGVNSGYISVTSEGSLRIYNLNSIIYCDPTYFDDEIIFSFDGLSLDENGEIVREEGTVIESKGHWNWEQSKTFETNQTVTHTETINGKSVEVTEKVLFSVMLTLKPRETAKEYRIIQYGQNGEKIESTTVTKEDAGEFEVKEECAFIVAEEQFFSGGVCRTLCEKNENSWGEIEFYFDGGFGILAKTIFKPVNQKGEARESIALNQLT